MSQAPPRVLMTTPCVDETSDVYGYTASWVRGVARRASEVAVLTFRLGPADLPGNVRVVDLSRGAGGRAGRLARLYREAAPLLARRRVEGVFCHMGDVSGTLLGPLARAARIPLVAWHTHTGDNPWIRPMRALATRVLTATPTSIALPVDGERIRAVGHGIDAERFREARAPPPPGPFVLLGLGRVAPIKRYDDLIRLVADLRGRGGKDVVARIVGGTPDQRHAREKARLEALCRELKVDDAVEFAGPVPYPQVPAVLRGAHVVVNSGVSGLDKAVLEAMAAGRPVLTCSPSHQGVHPEGYGWLHHAPGDVDAMAAIVARWRALDGPAREAASAALVREVETRHGVDHIADLVLQEFLPRRPA